MDKLHILTVSTISLVAIALDCLGPGSNLGSISKFLSLTKTKRFIKNIRKESTLEYVFQTFHILENCSTRKGFHSVQQFMHFKVKILLLFIYLFGVLDLKTNI